MNTIIKKAYFYAKGKRKNAVATVRLFPEGTGEVTINGSPLREWSDNEYMTFRIKQPLRLLGITKEMDLVIITTGGGKSAQAEAVCLGIARAFVRKDITLRTQLKGSGLLTRDSRVKERKKPGCLKARRSPQWSKR